MILTTAVLVMGAGIQGCCTALELARQGMCVTLLDQDRLPMNRTSLRNEGKIHLGLVYANDLSMQTAELQLRGAMTFWPLISRWTGCKPDELAVCNPFYYLVAEDSLMNPAELEEHYERLQKRYDRLLSEDPELNYLGQRPECLFRRLNDRDIRSHFNEKQVIAAFSTEERSVSTEPLAECIRNAVDRSAKIGFLPGFHATSLSRRHGGFCVEGDGSTGHWCIHADQVVNATWDGRRKLDRQIGLESDGWLYRLKYRVIVKIPPELYESPSATMVLGRYGDVVIRPDHSAYLSWYPEAIRGWSHAMKPPDRWQDPCQGKVSREDTVQIANEMSHAIDQWYPGIAGAQPILVDAGVIVALGQSDIDDKSSGLHQRSQVGVTSVDGYHSLDAGKLTTSPMFARIAANRVAEG